MAAAHATPRKEPALNSPEGTVDPLANPPTNLLDLPDELILRIFSQLAPPLLLPYEFDCLRHQSFIRKISLNRRIYRLCRHLSYRDVVLPRENDRRADVLAMLTLRRNTLPTTERLDAAYDESATHLEHAALASFTDITHLTLRSQSFSPVLLKALSSLRRLHTLTYLSEGDYLRDEAHELDLERYAPHVRHLIVRLPRASHYDTVGDLVKGLKKLKALELELMPGAGGLDDCIPWEGLSSLAIRSKSPIKGAAAFIGSLEAALAQKTRDSASNRALQLRRVVLDFPTGYNTGNGVFTDYNLAQTLVALSATSVDELELHDLLNTGSIRANVHLSLPSVRKLTLCSVSLHVLPSRSGRSGYRPCTIHLKALHNFLKSFPTLKSLVFTSSEELGWPARITTKSECALQYPFLFALLHLLSETTVVDLRVRWPKERKELRWTRSLGETEWENERSTWDEAM